MSFAKCFSVQTIGLRTHVISVEVDISRGLHSFSLVGLPDKSVEESKDRISAAIKNSGFTSPKQKNQKVLISLAPAGIRKEGALFDLPAALAYLRAEEEIRFDPEKRIFVGELSLDGELRPIKGALLIAEMAKKEGFTEIFLPEENAEEAAMVKGISVFGAQKFLEVVDHINLLPPPEGEGTRRRLVQNVHKRIDDANTAFEYGFEDIKGQESAKRGLEIAAAGGHNVLLSGPPGTGKTMLAKAFSQILPALSFEMMLEVTGIHSVAGALREKFVVSPPFRSPHHTASYVSLIGGGAFPKPGEITLAHRGVLFLDEFPEFDRRVLETLREPLEERTVSISRARGTERFPANFILVAAMNPCPCGNTGSKKKECVCNTSDILRYSKKISGPLLDRIDISLQVAEVEFEKFSDGEKSGEISDTIRARVQRTRDIQARRFSQTKKQTALNAEMGNKDLERFAVLGEGERHTLNVAAERLGLSPRAYHRTIKVSRTIADLDGSDTIREPHILEALSYRGREG